MTIGIEYNKVNMGTNNHLIRIFQTKGQENPNGKAIMKAILNLAL